MITTELNKNKNYLFLRKKIVLEIVLASCFETPSDVLKAVLYAAVFLSCFQNE